MKKQEMQERVTVDVDTTAVDTLSAELAAAVAPTNLDQAPVEELFDNEKKLDEELEVSEGQIQAEGVQVASTDAAAAMVVADTTTTESAIGGGAASADGGVSPLVWAGGALLTAGAIVVATDDDDDDKSSGSTTPPPAPVVDTVPVVTPTQSITIQEGQTAPITVVGTDADGDQLLYTASNGANGVVTVSGQQNQFTYTPSNGFVGTDTFTVTVSDEDGNNVVQTITVTVTAAPLTVEDKTFDLEGGQDTVVGTAEGDTINAKFDTSGDNSFTAFDSIDGGAGVDTFNIFTDGGTNQAFPTNASVNNVEIINIFNEAAAGAFGDASKFVGATQLNQIGDDAVAVTKLGAGTTAGFKGTKEAIDVTAAATATSASVNLDGVTDAVDGGTSTPELNVMGAALNTVTVTGNILASEAGSAAALLTLNVEAGKDVQAVTVSTSVATELSVENEGTSTKEITSVDASGSTGNVAFFGDDDVATIKTGSGNDEVELDTNTGATLSGAITATVETGAGNDTVEVGTFGKGKTTVSLGDGNDTVTITQRSEGLLTLNAGAGDDKFVDVDLLGSNTATKVDGGAGFDRLAITTGGALVAEDFVLLDSAVSNVEGLKFGAPVTGADGSKLAQFSELEFVGVGNNATKISASQKVIASTIDVTAAGFVAATATTALTGGTLDITSKEDGTVTAQSEVVNLTVTTKANSTTDVTTTLDGSLAQANVTLVSTENVNPSGTPVSDNIASVEYTADADSKTFVVSGEGSAVVDNSAGKLTSVDASGLSNTLFNGNIGDGLDYTANDGVKETVSLSGGTDTVTTDSTFKFMDTINGFDAVKETDNAKSTTDTIVFNGTTLDGSVVDQAEELTLSANATSLNLAFVEASASGAGVKFFQFGGNTYLFEDTGTTAGTLDDGDAALKVTGLVDFSDDFAVFA